ncbi:uncharacterized protein LOC128221546 [Mya arenaria]|uniref:uncharacterized protein LOC128221546 n=1 Tax=Mya arenaria TaxID=6604 RepID=UPI0022E96157|nr:uncharacterized protein LOC128221546 [Mya arenaria]
MCEMLKAEKACRAPKMSDLPTCRTTPSPPFTYVGVDTFGPWLIVSRRGTNFVGATGELGMNILNVEDGNIKQFLTSQGAVLRFNAPHSSHMAGSWERMIGLARRILESMLCESQVKSLTHEVLCIMNSRAIAPVANDLDTPAVLSPNVLLTQKFKSDTVPYQHWNTKDIYKSQWRQVQVLADQFWKRWRTHYLQNLQTRRKLKEGDVVLMMDSSVSRIQWPIGVIEDVFPSANGQVRKVSVRVVNSEKPVTYISPITQIIHLLSE